MDFKTVRRPFVLALLFSATIIATATAQNAGGSGTEVERHSASAPIAQAVRTTVSIQIDGHLTEGVWGEAPVITGLTQMDPEEGQPVSERTEFRIVYDDDAIYIAVWAFDQGEFSTRLGRRDMNLSDSDWIGVVIDSYHDHRTGYSFDVNPSGVQRDAIKSSNPGGHENDDMSWDGVWAVAATSDQDGWYAEYRIPFSQLRFGNADVQEWGIQLERVIGRRREYSVFAFVPKTQRGGIARYGHLTGLENVRPGNPLEVVPYTVAKSEHIDPGTNPYRTNSEQRASGGVDFLFRPTSNLTVNASINPDFGQVEVDPAVINLGVYETFFEEKRPFFIEGSEIFRSPQSNASGSAFYSRRIGRRPQLGAPTSRADTPTETTILGSAKVSGKTSNGWSVGFLDAVTSEETSRYLDGLDVEQEMPVEPLTNYFVGRVRKDMRNGQTSFGVLATAVNRRLNSSALDSSLSRAAYSGGFDWNHEFSNRNWAFRGNVSGSRVEGSNAAMTIVQTARHHYFQRPDADHLDVDLNATSINGYSASATVVKQSGHHWLGSIGGALTSGSYEVNDLGFAMRTDRRDIQGNITYRETQPGTFFRYWVANATVRNEQNFSGDNILRFANSMFHFSHLNYWSGTISVGRMFRALDDRSTRGGPLMTRPANTNVSANFQSDGRKPFTVGLGGGIQRDEFGGGGNHLGINLQIKTSPRWNLTIGPQMQWLDIPAQYLGTVSDPTYTQTFGNRYLFANLDYREFSIQTRFNFTFKPGLTLETYIQPLISAGDFGPATYLTASRSFDFAVYPVALPDFDFNVRSLRGNAVLRWEWRPGSNLYLAWQRRQYESGSMGTFDLGRDLSGLFGLPSDNIFLLKVSTWFNP